MTNATHQHSSLSGGLFDELVMNGEIYKILKTDWSLIFYGTIVLISMILAFGRSFLYIKVTITASKNLHSRMFHTILEVPMNFFTLNPCGKILNRFSKDVGAMDEFMPKVLFMAVQVILDLFHIFKIKEKILINAKILSIPIDRDY